MATYLYDFDEIEANHKAVTSQRAMAYLFLCGEWQHEHRA
jgi:hypothetical protein